MQGDSGLVCLLAACLSVCLSQYYICNMPDQANERQKKTNTRGRLVIISVWDDLCVSVKYVFVLVGEDCVLRILLSLISVDLCPMGTADLRIRSPQEMR